MCILKNKVRLALQSKNRVNSPLSTHSPLPDIQPPHQTTQSPIKASYIVIKRAEEDVKEESTDNSETNFTPSFVKIDVKQSPKSTSKPTKIRHNKNVVKNYGRAMVNFSLSDLALPYIYRFAAIEGVSVIEFRAFMHEKKRQVHSIRTLRDMLIYIEGDNDKTMRFKRVFKALCEVFVKEFSVNWIFNSKLVNRSSHMMYRFKILRRVRQPEYFTYLE